MAAEENTSI